MCEKIIKTLKNLSEPKFAQWLMPLLNVTDDSDEIVLGVRMPILRKMAKEYKDVSYETVENLLKSNYHETRMLAVLILLIKVKKEPQKVCAMYLDNLEHINNWDLIDYSAPHIVAPNVNDAKLRELAQSDYLWANRVAMVSTIYFIKQQSYELALEFATKFMSHPHHLMHKASGWMLREVGKQNKSVLIDFLEKYSPQMPSVMRSYAKERL